MSNHLYVNILYLLFVFSTNTSIMHILNRKTAVMKNILRLVHIDLLITHSIFN